MPPLNLPFRVFGRPLKPVSLGFAIFMAVLTAYNIADRGVLGSSMWGDVLAVIAGSSFLLLAVAWWTNSQIMSEYGLLLACMVFVTRGVFLLLTFGWTRQDVYFSLAAAIITGGSYFLERYDPNDIRSRR